MSKYGVGFELGVIVFGLLLRLHQLGGPALWYDEAGSLLMVRGTFWQMVEATRWDVHPPAYLSLLWLWALVSHDAAWLRLLSVAWSLAGLFLLWAVCRRLALGRTTTQTALLLMAVAPLQINYAQDARMYAMLQALVLGALLAGLHRRWVLYGLLVAAMAYTHNYFVFYALPLAVVLWLRGAEVRPVLAANLGAAVLWLPWAVWGLAHQVTQVGADGHWIQVCRGGCPLYVVGQLFWGYSAALAIVPAVIITAAGLLLGLWHVFAHPRDRNLATVAVLAVAPLVGALLVSEITRPMVLMRGLIGMAPALYILWALPFRGKWGTEIAFLFMLPVVALSLNSYYNTRPIKNGDPVAIVEQLEAAGVAEGAALWHVNEADLLQLSIYAPHWHHYVMPYSTCAHDPTVGGLWPGSRAAMGLQELDLATVADQHRQVVIMWTVSPVSSACEIDTAELITAQAVPIATFEDNERATSGAWWYAR